MFMCLNFLLFVLFLFLFLNVLHISKKMYNHLFGSMCLFDFFNVSQLQNFKIYIYAVYKPAVIL